MSRKKKINLLQQNEKVEYCLYINKINISKAGTREKCKRDLQHEKISFRRKQKLQLGAAVCCEQTYSAI